jgi:hypothetical protein
LEEQAKVISNDIKQFNLKHYMIDAEENTRVYPGARWKSYPKYRAVECAKVYMDNLDVPDGFPVGLCSYRFPNVHREFPWNAFLTHPKLTMVNPQVYWMFNNNPGYQTATSLAQYREYTTLPFLPVGAAYEESGWAPTAKEIGEFRDLCKENFDAWSYYRWGQAKNHVDWLNAMKVEVEPVPEPPPEPTPEPPPPHECEIPTAKLVPGISALRVRRGPSTGYGTIDYVRPSNPVVEILGRKVISEATEWFRIGYRQWSAARYNGRRYLEEL